MKIKVNLNLKQTVQLFVLLISISPWIVLSAFAGNHTDYESSGDSKYDSSYDSNSDSTDSYDSNYSSSTYYQYFKKPGDLSVGLLLGSQVGATATYTLTHRYSLELAGAMELGGHQNIYSWGTLISSYPDAFHLGSFSLGWFWGAGGKFRSENNPDLKEEYLMGPRGVVGLTKVLSSWAVELFGQVGYTQYVTQVSKGEMDFFLGARYFF